MKDMTDRYTVMMDSAVEKVLFVHMPDKIVVFRHLEEIYTEWIHGIL